MIKIIEETNKSIEHLFLNNNNLKYLPDTIGEYFQLRILDISNNMVETLPESACQLKNLQILYMHNNLLTYIPDFFAHLINLQFCSLSNNPFVPPFNKLDGVCSGEYIRDILSRDKFVAWYQMPSK